MSRLIIAAATAVLGMAGGCPAPIPAPSPLPPMADAALMDAAVIDSSVVVDAAPVPVSVVDAGAAALACATLAKLGCPEGKNIPVCVTAFNAAAAITSTNASCIAWQTTTIGIRSCGTFVSCIGATK